MLTHEKGKAGLYLEETTQRFKMLTRWITLTAFLAASADLVSAALGPSALTVTPTCRFKGHPEVELTLSCGDERKAGVVQYWHTPFGDLETPGSFNKLDPVFMHHDGSLVVPNISSLHSGLYYCLLQHKEGATLWSYDLRVSHDNEIHEHSDHGQQNCGAFRIRRDVGSAREQEGVSDREFAGAVAASVLLTFVVGFSAGALTRTQVLRCLGTVTLKLRSIRHKRQSDSPDHGSKVNVTNLPSLYDNQAFEMEQVEMEEATATCAAIDSTISSTTLSPPAKPQRSFREKREQQQETKAYLEGCDYMKVEEIERRSLEENIERCDVEAEEEKEFRGSFCFSDKDGGSQTETEEECSEDQEVREERESKEEEKMQCEKAEKLENSVISSSTEDEEESRLSKDVVGDTEKRGEENREGEEEMREEKEADDKENKNEENAAIDICSSDDAEDDKHQDRTKTCTREEEAEAALTSQPSHGRRSRVIRLYQYDEDGQRYGHLPQPKPDEPGPAPRLKQRSLSLTRLSAIMAAASEGPLNTRETGKEERPHFHMEI